MVQHVEVRSGAYHDSVALMEASRDVGNVSGVTKAMLAMGTELNLDLLRGMGFDDDEIGGVGPNDLVVAITADDDDRLAAGRIAADKALAALASRRPSTAGLGDQVPSATVVSAARQGTHDLALISVPGAHAFTEAMDALGAGMSVMVFSDNVPLEQEITLKTRAGARGLLVMGPDCGTAIIAGAGLGFANVVHPGRVGIVGASGTGTQQLCCLLDDAGVGISHAIGVGGRDLSAEVGGVSTLAALAALDADAATDVIAIVSKPPDPKVAAAIAKAAGDCATPTVTIFVGSDDPALPADLHAGADAILDALGHAPVDAAMWPPAADPPQPDADDDAPAPVLGPRGPRLIGLFAGGTLCDEAMVIASARLGPIASNIPLQPDWDLGADLTADGHTMIDFGDDRMTQGRAHPMIDQTLRLERLEREAADPRTGVILLDVVLGHGAHPDPASELAPAILAARKRAVADGRNLTVVVSLCGSSGDPQDRNAQARALAGAGAHVHSSNARAARAAVAIVTGEVA